MLRHRKRRAALGLDRYPDVGAWRCARKCLVSDGAYQQADLAVLTAVAALDLKVDVSAVIGLRDDLAGYGACFADSADTQALRSDEQIDRISRTCTDEMFRRHLDVHAAQRYQGLKRRDADELAAQAVGVADKGRHEAVGRPPIDVERCAELADFSIRHHRHPV